jgi:hypothetical protein
LIDLSILSAFIDGEAGHCEALNDFYFSTVEAILVLNP